LLIVEQLVVDNARIELNFNKQDFIL